MPRKLTYEYVKSYIESEGYSLLSDSYKSARDKLDVLCLNGHEWSVDFHRFERGVRCCNCSSNKKLTYEYVKSYIESNGYELLSKEFINSASKLCIKCPKGHTYDVTYGNFYSGWRCPFCKADNISKSQTLTYDYVKNYIESNGYKLLSNSYSHSKDILELQCSNGHTFNTRFNYFQQGHGCSKCWSELGSSKQERDVQYFVETMGFDIIKNDRSQIVNPVTGYSLELDIWIPSMNKAIEYNGTYWHSLNDRVKKDVIKRDQCKQKDIDLLVVSENDWIDNNGQCKRDIIEFLEKGIR